MRALVLMALFGGDAGAAESWQAWLRDHPMVQTDAGFEMRCANGARPRAERTDGGFNITCRPRAAP